MLTSTAWFLARYRLDRIEDQAALQRLHDALAGRAAEWDDEDFWDPDGPGRTETKRLLRAVAKRLKETNHEAGIEESAIREPVAAAARP